jgi:hypothetical protein
MLLGIRNEEIRNFQSPDNEILSPKDTWNCITDKNSCEGEFSDPKLTLNLLRQKGETEIRCGSA